MYQCRLHLSLPAHCLAVLLTPLPHGFPDQSSVPLWLISSTDVGPNVSLNDINRKLNRDIGSRS
ncbi:hypothetical protein DPMN_104374 [Dreissena polymorpha]|uniref:Uncharacterized protein n=1 Tax=Dreissena polymorpha TaxID=45954 RepID=A0A9D4K2Q6_DREPO|nr:hypothetical protein DPMN_104374 [Dreissena polymorpha]